MSEPLKPSVALLTKLGSIAVHADEAMSDEGHHFDVETIKSLLSNPEVKDWLSQMDAMCLLPQKRSAR